MWNLRNVIVFLALLKPHICQGYVQHASRKHLRNAGNKTRTVFLLGQPGSGAKDAKDGETHEAKPIVEDPKEEGSTHEVREVIKNPERVVEVPGVMRRSIGIPPLPTREEARYPVIHWCHERLGEVFAKRADVWWRDWKLWVGFVIWLFVGTKWSMSLFTSEDYYERALFAFSVNIMILHLLQYAANIQVGMLYVNFFLALQNLVHNIIAYQSDHKQFSVVQEFECDTLYLDLALPFMQIMVLFVAQVCIWWFYMTSILYNFDFGQVNYAFWMVAYLVMQMTMIFNRGSDSVLGSPFPVHDVCHMVKHAGHVRVYLKSDGESAPRRLAGSGFSITKTDLIARGIMGFFCNSILRDIMSYTIPLMLMSFSEPMDFVVYCVGVNFICTVDDMASKTYLMKDTSRAIID